MQTEDLDQSQQDALNASDQMSSDSSSGAESEAQDTTPGAVLKAERLRRNLSEKDISDKLHITMHYVRAIEANRFDKLPGAVFAKGYIKSYALYLNLDVDAVTSLFEGINSQQEEQKVEANRRLMAQRRSDRNKPWVYASVATFVIGFTGLWAYSQYAGDEPAAVATPAAQAESPTAAAPSVRTPAANAVASNTAIEIREAPVTAAQPLTVTGTAANQQEQDPQLSATDSSAGTDSLTSPDTETATTDEPNLVAVLSALASEPAAATDKPGAGNLITVGADGGDVLRIHFSGESWVEVNDKSEQQIYRDIREAGDVLEIKGEAPFSILLGDAPFAKMYLNGTEIDVSDDIRIDNSARLTVGL